MLSKKYLSNLIVLNFLAYLVKSAPGIVSDSNLYDVLVIGGGVSGLSTLSELATKYGKTNTILVEGADRLGGRIYTIPFGNNSLIEIGAQVTK